MALSNDRHRKTAPNLPDSCSRGYLPHYDGIEIPQIVTIHLADSMPTHVLDRWRQELKALKLDDERILLQPRIREIRGSGHIEMLLATRHVILAQFIAAV